MQNHKAASNCRPSTRIRIASLCNSQLTTEEETKQNSNKTSGSNFKRRPERPRMNFEKAPNESWMAPPGCDLFFFLLSLQCRAIKRQVGTPAWVK